MVSPRSGSLEFRLVSCGFPLYQEINRKGESRVLLVGDRERVRCCYYCRMWEQNLGDRHHRQVVDGLSLITHPEDADG